MIQFVNISEGMSLMDYAAIGQLTPAVQELLTETKSLASRLKGHRLCMVNSTAQGGGVAEMLPKMISLLRELGVPTRWVVIGTEHEEFFSLTKRIHNLIHGQDQEPLGARDRELYEAVNRENADDLRRHLRPEDILVVHDPQPAALGAILKKEMGLPAIWRCHIGLDERVDATKMAWSFLKPYTEVYDHSVFSVPEYIPGYLSGQASIIEPAIDPLSHKNRELPPYKLVGILANAQLIREHQPVTTPPFDHCAKRLRPDGSWGPANSPEEIGLMYRPIITQVSRWDRLKGFRPLFDGFRLLKTSILEGKSDEYREDNPRHLRELEITRLVLAGPDPASIQDDPEGREVLDDLCKAYTMLEPELQRDVALISLPMESRKENALMVNALQRCSTVVVQNSLREGFGLTVTEAMWKGCAVMGTNACGVRHQVREGVDGVLVADAENPEVLANSLDAILANPKGRDNWARNAQRRVYQEFLIFTQLRKWLRLIAETLDGSPSS